MAHQRKKIKFGIHLCLASTLFFVLVSKGYAMEAPTSKIILKTDFKIWEINKSNLDFFTDYEKTFFDEIQVKISQEDSSLVSNLLKNKKVEGIDMMKVKNYLRQKIAPDIDRDREDVIINMDEEGNVTFEGGGLYGRHLDIEKSAMMLREAIIKDIAYVNLPLITEPPVVTVLSDELKEMGITELFSAGETYFSGSPANRMHNIRTGLAKFNGHIIKQGEEFSFGDVLGRVDASTGYKPELVIKGDKVVPEYGGGLCQVSTTAYRAVLEGGLPVTERRNHSFAVTYYSPNGLDATVYPPSVDMKFKNDSPGAILMQSYMTDDAKAYYNFYGTKDGREVHLIGPYYYNYIGPPAERREYSEKLAPGEIQVAGHAVAGISSSWFNYVIYKGNEKEEGKSFLEHIYSKYQARPNFYIVGAEDSVQ